MQVPPLINTSSRLRLSALALALFSLSQAPILAQLPQFDFDSPPQTELTAPQVDVVSGPTAARLKQADALAKDRNWTEAIQTYRELSSDGVDQLVELGDDRYVSMRTYCQMQLAKLPAEGLAAYRRGADPLAERWYREAIADRDEQKLRRIAGELFCSSWGDDALLALGEMALERSEYAAARRWWEQISPMLRDPDALPPWLALRDIGVDANWPEIEKRWNNRPEPASWLAYPDSTLDLAGVRTRLILVSIRAGEFDRAELELDQFRQMHPTAAGPFGGKSGSYVDALDRLLATARDWPAHADSNWPTFAGSQSRCGTAPAVGPVLNPAWQQPITLSIVFKAHLLRPENERDAARESGDIRSAALSLIDAQRESNQPMSCYPIVVDNLVVFNDGRRIRAVDLATGRPAVTKNGTLYREDARENPEADAKLDPNRRIRSYAASGVPRCTLNALDGIVYSRVGRFPTVFMGSAGSLNADRLIGIDLYREGLLAFQTKKPDSSWSFDGSPVGDGRHIWVAMRRRDVSTQAYVACFDAASAAEIWRTSIGAADTPAAGAGHEITHNLLTLVDDRIYFNTNLGLVAALDALTGDIRWMHQYERTGDSFPIGLDGPLHFDRDPSPCMFHNGLLVVAPADTPAVFALDSHTGRRIWANDQLPDVLHLLGVVDQNLIVSGNRVRALDIRSGQQRFAWPESEHPSIRGIGRGVIAGEEVFWPARDSIYALNAVTGQRTRSPFKPAGVRYRGANLAAAHGYLIVTTHDTLVALGLPPVALPRTTSRSTVPLRTGRFPGLSPVEASDQ